MRFARLCGIAVLLSLTTAPLAAAEEAVQPEIAQSAIGAPQWRVGSSWEYSDGYGLRVSSSQDGTTVFERMDSPGQWFSMRGFLRQDSESGSTKRQTIFRSISPTAGESLSAAQPLTFQREYLSNKQLVVHASSWSVEGRQRITVPAGTFDCWVIVWRARSLKSDWTGFERWWYSPEAQQYVRLEYKYGNAPTASRVLMRYRLAEPGEALAKSANAATPEAAPIARQALSALELAPVALDPEVMTAVAPLPLPDMQISDVDPETPGVKIASAAPTEGVVEEALPAALSAKKVKSVRPVQAKPKVQRRNRRRR